jgi:tetratricopeptide (TPR) repeat protein
MEKILRQIIALPLVILRDLLSVVPIYNKLEVMRWICIVTDSREDALAYITALINGYGAERFEQPAFEQMSKYADARFALAAGMDYLNRSKFREALNCVERAEKGNCQNLHELLMLKFLLTDDSDKKTRDDLIDRIISSTDLGAECSQFAWTFKCWSLLENRKFEEASRVADRILAIQENGIAILVKWATTFERNPIAAREYFDKAQAVWKYPYFEASVAQGWYVLGDMAAAAKYLRIARRNGFHPAGSDTIFSEIMRSEEYNNS